MTTLALFVAVRVGAGCWRHFKTEHAQNLVLRGLRHATYLAVFGLGASLLLTATACHFAGYVSGPIGFGDSATWMMSGYLVLVITIGIVLIFAAFNWCQHLYKTEINRNKAAAFGKH